MRLGRCAGLRQEHSITKIMSYRNTAGQLLTNGLANLYQGEMSEGVVDRGWVVAGGLGLDSMAVNSFFSGLSILNANVDGAGAASSALQTLAITRAAQGGKMTRGHFLWNEPESSRFAGQNRFTFPMNPESIEESVEPVYAETTVPGQNRPMYQFINGGPRKLKFTLNFFYESRKRSLIRDQIDALKSLTQRRYTGVLGGAYGGPPPLNFFYGDYFRGERFIVQSLSIRSFDLFDPATLLPMRADVDITLAAVLDTMAVAKRNGANLSEQSLNIPSIIQTPFGS